MTKRQKNTGTYFDAVVTYFNRVKYPSFLKFEMDLQLILSLDFLPQTTQLAARIQNYIGGKSHTYLFIIFKIKKLFN